MTTTGSYAYLIEGFNEEDPTARNSASQLATLVCQQLAPLIDEIAEALPRLNPTGKATAIDVIGPHISRRPLAIRAIVNVLLDTTVAEPRTTAAYSLRHAVNRDSVVRALAQVAESTGDPAQQAAIQTLGPVSDQTEIHSLLTRLASSEVLAVRMAARGALADRSVIERQAKSQVPPTTSSDGDGETGSDDNLAEQREIDDLIRDANDAIAVGDDPEGMLSETTAILTRGDPKALIAQVRDVQRRMNRLADEPVDHGLQRAAKIAEVALDAVMALLDGELEPHQARPSIRGVVFLVSEVLESGLAFASPQAAAALKCARLIAVYILDRE